MNSEVTVYSLNGCYLCEKAKEHLEYLGKKYTEIKYAKGVDTEKIMELIERTDCTSFPQIFVGDDFIGGHDQIVEFFNNTEF
jgi:glutaredoxin